MTKRKILGLALTLCMVAILAVGGTLAYFMDTEKVTNTMVIGNISINIDEWTYVADAEGNRTWVPFENDAFKLNPLSNDEGVTLWNKMVYTANTSSSENDAYIRTIIMFEANTEISATNETGCCIPGLHYSFATNETAESTTDGKTYTGSKDTVLPETVTIGDKEYWVVVFEQKDEEAIAYDAALYSISGVWMDENVTSDQLDGWGNDGKVDIIVFSQGIQAEGLEYAEAMAELGEINEGNLNTWLSGANNADVDDWTTKTKN